MNISHWSKIERKAIQGNKPASSETEETLVREGERVYRVNSDGSGRGYFISGGGDSGPHSGRHSDMSRRGDGVLDPQIDHYGEVSLVRSGGKKANPMSIDSIISQIFRCRMTNSMR